MVIMGLCPRLGVWMLSRRRCLEGRVPGGEGRHLRPLGYESARSRLAPSQPCSDIPGDQRTGDSTVSPVPRVSPRDIASWSQIWSHTHDHRYPPHQPAPLVGPQHPDMIWEQATYISSRRCPWRDARAGVEIRRISTISPGGIYFRARNARTSPSNTTSTIRDLATGLCLSSDAAGEVFAVSCTNPPTATPIHSGSSPNPVDR